MSNPPSGYSVQELEPDPETGYNRLWTTVCMERYPILQRKNCRFRLALMSFDGGIHIWVSHTEDSSVFGAYGYEVPADALGEIPLHSRAETITLIGRLGDWGFIPQVFAEDEVPTDLITFTMAAGNPKTAKDRTNLIAKHSHAIWGRELTADEVWNGLPKQPLLELGRLYSIAVSLERE